MHVISRRILLEFAKVHPEVALPLDSWYRVAKSAKWSNISLVDGKRQISKEQAKAIGIFFHVSPDLFT